MEYLKNKILTVGEIKEGNILKVDSFLNHQIDVECMNKIGEEFKKRFENDDITKILTIEASGIAVAVIASQYFNNIPVVFAKKTESKNLDESVYESEVYSYTKDRKYTIRVSKKYLSSEDKVLIIDDFLANGSAALGLVDLVNKANAKVSGIGIVIEKSFQEGGAKIKEKNIKLESLVKIKFGNDNEILFD